MFKVIYTVFHKPNSKEMELMVLVLSEIDGHRLIQKWNNTPGNDDWIYTVKSISEYNPRKSELSRFTVYKKGDIIYYRESK